MMSNEDIMIFYFQQPTYNRQMIERTESELKRLSYKSIKTSISLNYGKYNSKTVNRTENKFKAPTNNLFFKVVHNRDKKKVSHPNQKPVDLIEFFINTYTNIGDLVLDNTAGSGTTAEACLNIKRQFIVMEKEFQFFEIIKKRVSEHKRYIQ